ncbi:MAG: phosphatase PAP2 family protein [Enterobacterales bacterium endosymbiont of Blomia tropicalis]|uniref:phosphatase PAP2 family protein n=1 Tax=Mixta mediterraneensis TaxID=2758443 RepID=UPI0025A6CE48|nr:phosphatase PAP2 family protein [Mixta mediterraneensis]MDL4913819.1 phosphatase PAP2 family protein [Mixta mediterraneensis]
MAASRLITILLLNALGAVLFLSWYLPPEHGFWFGVDKAIFFSFNKQMVAHPGFALLVAMTNFRGFDLISLLAMGLLYLTFWRRETPQGRRKLLAIGITMLLTAVVLNQLGHLLPVQHASPTLFFENVHRVSELTGIPAKDASKNSFPGDHGMMLIIFACFMWRYFGFRPFLIAAAIVIIFALPRIMAGAHWFTDVAVGSLSIILVGLSWWLLTPASDVVVNWFYRKLPARHKRQA